MRLRIAEGHGCPNHTIALSVIVVNFQYVSVFDEVDGIQWSTRDDFNRVWIYKVNDFIGYLQSFADVAQLFRHDAVERRPDLGHEHRDLRLPELCLGNGLVTFSDGKIRRRLIKLALRGQIFLAKPFQPLLFRA